MTALTADRATPRRHGLNLGLPLAANAVVWQGAMVAVSTTTGYATKGATSTTLRGVGVALQRVDNTGGADGAKSIEVERGCWAFANSTSTDAIGRGDIGQSCYMVDDQTVAKTNGGGTRGVAGVVTDVDAKGVWVTF